MTKCLTVEGVCGTGHSRRALAARLKKQQYRNKRTIFVI